MKKIFKLFAALPLAFGMLLAGCGNKPAPAPAKTVEEVVTDINDIFSGLGIENLLSWYDDYSCYIGGLNLGTAEATTDEEHVNELKGATEFVVSYLPEYLTVDDAGYETAQDDYYIGLSVDKVGVGNFGYVNGSGNVIVQIQVASIAE